MSYFRALVGIFMGCLLTTQVAALENRETDSLAIIQILQLGEDNWNKEPESALTHFKKAAQLADSLELMKLSEKAHYGIAKSYYILSDYHPSLIHFEKGLKLSQILGNPQGIIYGLNGCGIALTMLDKEDLAIEKHRQAITLCIKEKDYRQWAKNLFNISIAYDGIPEADSSWVYAGLALDMAAQHEEINMICQYRNHLGYLQIDRGEYHDAIKTFNDNLSAEGFTNQWEIQFAIAGLSKAYSELGLYNESIKRGEEAFAMATRINSKWDIKEVANILSNSYEKSGNFKQALGYHKIFKEYNDSIYNEEKAREINYHLLLEEQYLNENLRLENTQYQQKIKRKNLIIGGLVTLAVLFLLFVYTVTKLNRQKSRLLHEVEENNKKIEEQKSQLEDLNRTKDKLFRIIAHDLRTPIGVMTEFTELLNDNYDSYSKETIQKFLAAMNKSSRHGHELLNNLLGWAQSQTGQIPFQPEEIKVERMLDKTLGFLSTQATLKNVVIEKNFDRDLSIHADANLLRIVISNLISNAIKFSHPGGKIIITGRQKEGAAEFCVRDFGTGVPEEKSEKLFHTIVESCPGTGNEKGTGLGLTLCREFVERHGGAIYIDKSVQQGSLFCFTIPQK